jgi:hypothetical protein
MWIWEFACHIVAYRHCGLDHRAIKGPLTGFWVPRLHLALNSSAGGPWGPYRPIFGYGSPCGAIVPLLLTHGSVCAVPCFLASFRAPRKCRGIAAELVKILYVYVSIWKQNCHQMGKSLGIGKKFSTSRCPFGDVFCTICNVRRRENFTPDVPRNCRGIGGLREQKLSFWSC